jgi:cell division protein FtsW (lipid II flippase)
MHNKLFLAVVLAAVVIAVYKIFEPDGLALGYGVIAVGIILVASVVWSKVRRPNS